MLHILSLDKDFAWGVTKGEWMCGVIHIVSLSVYRFPHEIFILFFDTHYCFAISEIHSKCHQVICWFLFKAKLKIKNSDKKTTICVNLLFKVFKTFHIGGGGGYIMDKWICWYIVKFDLSNILWLDFKNENNHNKYWNVLYIIKVYYILHSIKEVEHNSDHKFLIHYISWMVCV